MADRKISDLTALTTPASGDYLPIVDISEAAAASKNKRITIEELFRGVPLGTAAAPSIAIEGNENTGVYSPGANQLAVATNGTGRLFVDATGQVGIGVAAPSHLLQLNGPTATTLGLAIRPTGWNLSHRFSVPTSGDELVISSNYNGSTVDDATAGTSSSTFSTGLIKFATGAVNAAPTERLRITSAGLVGIGSSAPVYRLDVSGGAGDGIRYLNTSNSVGVQLGTSSSSAQIGSVTSHPTEFLVGAVERARIDTSGRLLVGTSTSVSNAAGFTPSIQVAGSGVLAAASIARYSGDAFQPQLSLQKSRGGIGTQSLVSANDALGHIAFEGSDGSSFKEAASIKVEVDGTPSANDMPGRLVFSVTADSAASPTERMRISQAGTNFVMSSANGVVVTTTVSAGTADYIYLGYHSGTAGSPQSGTYTYGVFTNGNVVNTNNSYGAISDVKLKENIVEAGSQWDDLKALQVRKYNFKEGQTHTQIGLVAQEVELVSPGLVTESPDRDAEGNDLGTVTKSVNYSVLYMKAVKALQEAMERIETLEAKVAALETA